jgi:hypothetical protein
MSAVIFNSVPGRMVAIETDQAEGFRLSVGGDDTASGSFSTTGFTTSFQMQQKVSAQFQVSLDRGLYAIPFGDDVGSMNVGLVHGILCDADRRGASTADTGQIMQNWYKRNKFQASRLSPITITVGESVYKGYVLGLAFAAEAAEGSVLRSQLQLAAWGVS